MTEYDLSNALADGTFIDWSSPSLWAGGKVPDNPSALVVFQPIAGKSYYVEIGSGESFKIGTLDMAAHFLRLSGSLTVQQGINILAPSADIDLLDGSLTAGSIHLAGAPDWLGISGDGQISVKGELYNQSSITADYQPGAASGTLLTVHAGTLVNTGLLFASAHATLEVSATHFTNYCNGALIGGSYEAQNGTLKLHTPGPITIDDASLILVMDGPGAIQSFNPASGTYVPLESTLTTITARARCRSASAAMCPPRA